MKKYDVEIFAHAGETSEKLCTCEGKDTAVIIAKALHKGGKFKGPELLTGKDTDWDIRVLEYGDSNVEVVWDSTEEGS